MNWLPRCLTTTGVRPLEVRFLSQRCQITAEPNTKAAPQSFYRLFDRASPGGEMPTPSCCLYCKHRPPTKHPARALLDQNRAHVHNKRTHNIFTAPFLVSLPSAHGCDIFTAVRPYMAVVVNERTRLRLRTDILDSDHCPLPLFL